MKDEIVRKLTVDQAVVDARDRADDIQYDIMSEEDIQAAVDSNPDLKLKIEQTGFFA